MDKGFTRCRVQEIYSSMEFTINKMILEEIEVIMKERINPCNDLLSPMMIQQSFPWNSSLCCPRVLKVFESEKK